MDIAAIRRWQWVLLSLIAGALLGYARQQGIEDLQHNFGNSITGQRNFESFVLGTVEGRHTFDNLKVHKQPMPDGKGGMMPGYVVTGTAFLGDYETENGKQIARWKPTFFATTGPFKPRTNLGQFNVRGGPDYAAKFRTIKDPTVVDFLRILSDARGIPFRHAWWNELSIGWWVLASFVILGLIWPTVLNLMVFHSWRRPPDARALKLFGVKAHTRKPETTAPALDAERMDELEEQLAQTPPGVAATQAEVPAPVRILDSEPAAPVALAPEHSTEFGAKKDDFYPTEVHLPHPPK